MEPLNCTVHVRPDRCEVWTGTQVITRAQAEAAKATGLPLEKVVMHNHYLGGGIRPATGVRLRHSGGPHRPAGRRPGQGGLDPRGGHPARRVSALLLRPPHRRRWTRAASRSPGCTGSSARRSSPGMLPPGLQGRDRRRRGGRSASSCSTTSRRSASNTCATRSRCSTPGSGAASGVTHNNFVIESFIDELAAAAKQDPGGLPSRPARKVAAGQGGSGRRCARRAAGASRCPKAAAAALPSSTAIGTATWRRSPRCRCPRRARSGCTGWSARSIAARW